MKRLNILAQELLEVECVDRSLYAFEINPPDSLPRLEQSRRCRAIESDQRRNAKFRHD